MRLYIAGPMSGIPGHDLDAFARAADRLTEWGYEPVNPGRHGVTSGYEWGDYLRRGITELCACDGVAVLNDWATSPGARLEVHVARQLGMPVRPLKEWGIL